MTEPTTTLPRYYLSQLVEVRWRRTWFLAEITGTKEDLERNGSRAAKKCIEKRLRYDVFYFGKHFKCNYECNMTRNYEYMHKNKFEKKNSDLWARLI